MSKLLDAVNSQAEDDGLWFQAQTAPEAYLQQELRKLHGVIEWLSEGPREAGDLSCPDCGNADFADPETRAFVPVKSGVQTGTPHGPAVHWVEGWIVCRKCGHTEGAGESD